VRHKKNSITAEIYTSSSDAAERQCELGNFKGVGQFETKV